MKARCGMPIRLPVTYLLTSHKSRLTADDPRLTGPRVLSCPKMQVCRVRPLHVLRMGRMRLGVLELGKFHRPRSFG